jgi:hypothetical protein
MHSKGKERKEDKEISYSSNSEHLFSAPASDFSITPLPRKKTYIQTRKSKFKQDSKAQPKEKNHVIDRLRSSAAK